MGAAVIKGMDLRADAEQRHPAAVGSDRAAAALAQLVQRDHIEPAGLGAQITAPPFGLITWPTR